MVIQNIIKKKFKKEVIISSVYPLLIYNSKKYKVLKKIEKKLNQLNLRMNKNYKQLVMKNIINSNIG